MTSGENSEEVGEEVHDVTEKSQSVEGVKNPESEGEIPGYQDDFPERDGDDFSEGDSDFKLTRMRDGEYEARPSDNRRNEYRPPPPYPPSRLPAADEPVTLPNLFDADWLLQMEHAVGETAAHLAPDPMSYLRSTFTVHSSKLPQLILRIFLRKSLFNFFW